MAPDNYRFAEGDSLLCYHGPMLYEAKCLKRRKANDGKAQYFIHYKGWNSKWEEWVDDNRVLAVNAANMNKMASLKEMHSNAKKSGGKRSITIVKEETVRNVVTPPMKGKKRKYSEVSSELNQIVNVPSPAESKPKKRGRPPKIITPKIEETELTKSVDTTIVTETDVVTESTESTEENKVIDKATKEEDTAKKQDTAILVDSAKKEDIPKKENTPKKYNTPKKDNALKKYDTPKKEDILNKDIDLKKDDSPKKEEAPRKKDSPKKEDAPMKEDTPKKVEVVRSTDEAKATEEVLDTIKVEVNKNIAAPKEEEKTTKIADEEIKVLGEVENATEEIEKNKVVESCEGTKDIEETDTIKEVEGSETVKKIGGIEETETENFESIKESEAEELEGEKLEGKELEGEELEGEELEGEEFEGEELEGEEYEGEEIEGEELEGEELEGEELEDEEIDAEFEFDKYATLQLLKKYTELNVIPEDSETTGKAEGTDNTFTAPAPVPRKIKLPDIIRKRIAYDYCMIVEFKRELKLSKANSIDDLLKDYASYESDLDANRTIRLTIIQYFNTLIHKKLLYTPERKMNLKSKVKKCYNKRLDDGDVFGYHKDLYPLRLWHFMYGPSHLIRLFVLLPEILECYSHFEEHEIDILVKRWESFIKFVANNFDKYFPKNGEDYLPKE